MTLSREPVTMRDLADKLQVSTMTVSRALRNAAGVSDNMRKRVSAAAKQMNYRPDPALAALNMYRHGRRPSTVKDKIVFVTDFPTPDGWRQSNTFVRYFDGVCRRARQLGYDVEPFWLGAAGLTPQRASDILYGRGIRGVIVGPLVQGKSSLHLNWDQFSAVALGRSLESPGLTTVSINHFQAMELACREVSRLGYKRIGFAITHGEERRTVSALRASFMMQQEFFADSRLPPLVVPEFSADAIAAWATEHQPDVLLSSEHTHYDLLCAKLGRRAARIGFVHLNVNPATDMTGVDQSHDSVGEHAAALLHLKLIQRETGVPLRREMLLIHGKWKEGKGKWRLQPPVRA